MIHNLDRLNRWLSESTRAVFLGGAGVSVASGIPDFRSAGGLYSGSYAYPPEVMLSHDFFMERTEAFFAFYREHMIYPHAKPNAAHRALAAMERAGRLNAVITQNIDGLHQAAGGQNVLELHGSVLRNSCLRCGAAFGLETIMKAKGVPRCPCGGVIKPDVVLYGEGLPEDVLHKSVRAVRGADLLIVGGTSLAVYPAAGLIDYFRGERLVIINMTLTPRDGEAGLVFRDGVEDVLGALYIEPTD